MVAEPGLEGGEFGVSSSGLFGSLGVVGSDFSCGGEVENLCRGEHGGADVDVVPCARDEDIGDVSTEAGCGGEGDLWHE